MMPRGRVHKDVVSGVLRVGSIEFRQAKERLKSLIEEKGKGKKKPTLRRLPPCNDDM